MSKYHQMAVVITSGEKYLVNEINRISDFPTWEQKPLEVGDIGIVDPETLNTFAILIERKTPSDLHSSFVQGRYSDQRDRLRMYRDRTTGCKVGYILEGIPRPEHIKQIRGCLFNLQVYYGFFVLHTSNTKETAEAIKQLHDGLTKKRKTEACPQPVKALKLKPSDRLGESDWLINAITLIPGMSRDRSRAILQRYPTLQDLLNALCVEEKVNEIAELRVGGAQKRLGQTLARRIRDHMLHEPAASVSVIDLTV